MAELGVVGRCTDIEVHAPWLRELLDRFAAGEISYQQIIEEWAYIVLKLMKAKNLPFEVTVTVLPKITEIAEKCLKVPTV